MGKNRIIFNTLILYVKTVISIFISFYTTRIVLLSLGVDDFGLYTLIAGFIGALSFISSSMASATQRFLSFYIGENTASFVKNVFSSSVLIHLLIGVVMIFFFEVIGNYYIDYNILSDKIEIAKLLLHFMVVSTFFSIISVPNDAVVDANENMIFVAVIGIVESLFKLFIALSLNEIIEDKLFYYGLFLMLLSILLRIVKYLYTYYAYEECRINLKDVFFNVDFGLIKKILNFATWNVLGIVVYMVRNQGVIVLLGVFFSSAIVAAYGIANQVINQMSFFSETMMKTLRPQIIKSEGENDRAKMVTLSLQASKNSFFLISFFLLPIFFEIDFILSLWLKNIPDFTVVFCKYIIILIIIRQLTMGIIVASHAINDIKRFQLITSPLQLLSLPIGYFLYYLEFPIYSILIVLILTEVITMFLRMLYFKISIDYSQKKYFFEIVIKSILSFLIVFLLLLFLDEMFNNYVLSIHRFYKTIFMLFVSLVTYPILFYKLSLNLEERTIIKGYYVRLKRKYEK